MGVIDSRVLNIEDLTLEHFKKGDLFESTSARIGPLLGAKDLGYSYDVVPPGKRSCPFHSHRGEEEMFFILRGNGTLRFGDESRKIRAGDVICCPTGGPETAHQIINDSSADLAYLSVSTMMPAEICEYPDSKKIGAFGDGLRHLTRANDNVDYWTGILGPMVNLDPKLPAATGRFGEACRQAKCPKPRSQTLGSRLTALLNSR
jgi:uncharacterized cupin superfamily protein